MAVTAPLHSRRLVDPTAVADADPFVLLHGFTQNADSWGEFADRLAATRPVVAVDLPGHGGSSEVRADIVGTTELVAASTPPGVVVGYSMGGRVALHLALQHASHVHSLVLVSTTAGLDAADDRADRRTADEHLADRIEMLGVDVFLDEWLSQPLFADLTPEAARVESRRTNTAAGLASSLRLCGTGTQDPLWDRLHEIGAPTLVVVGARDTKFRAIGDRLVDAIGANATLVVVDEAGHNAPLERPDEVATAILAWTASIG